jgi:hypothetical protein
MTKAPVMDHIRAKVLVALYRLRHRPFTIQKAYRRWSRDWRNML